MSIKVERKVHPLRNWSPEQAHDVLSRGNPHSTPGEIAISVRDEGIMGDVWRTVHRTPAGFQFRWSWIMQPAAGNEPTGMHEALNQLEAGIAGAAVAHNLAWGPVSVKHAGGEVSSAAELLSRYPALTIVVEPDDGATPAQLFEREPGPNIGIDPWDIIETLTFDDVRGVLQRYAVSTGAGFEFRYGWKIKDGGDWGYVDRDHARCNLFDAINPFEELDETSLRGALPCKGHSLDQEAR